MKLDTFAAMCDFAAAYPGITQQVAAACKAALFDGDVEHTVTGVAPSEYANTYTHVLTVHARSMAAPVAWVHVQVQNGKIEDFCADITGEYRDTVFANYRDWDDRYLMADADRGYLVRELYDQFGFDA